MSFARITNRLMSNRSVENLHLNLQRLNDLQNKLSSGKNINVPSDDPVGLSRLLGIDETRKQDERYISNINNARSELNTTDALLSSTTDVIQRARELTVQASNQTNGPSELAAIREEVQQLLNQVVQVANTRFGNKYIFGGTRTNDAPYTTAGADVIYNGTQSTGAYQRNIEIGSGVVITVNFPGDDIFGQYDTGSGNEYGLINTLSTLINDLLDNDLDNVLSVQTTVGALVNRLDMTENRLQERTISLSKEYGSIQDVDLAKVISDLNFQESVFQTSLSATARVLQSSLLDYLR